MKQYNLVYSWQRQTGYCDYSEIYTYTLSWCSEVQRLKEILPQNDNVQQVGEHEYKHMYTIQ